MYRAIHSRRDMRHFAGGEVSNQVLERLLRAAHAAPSVGLMQPWRILRVTLPELRKAIHQQVEEERIATAKALGERESEFMRLKVEGVLDCAEVLVFALCDDRERYVFGRRTMPEMDLASLSCAIQNLWLAARAEGLGMGWVSLFEPDKLAKLLRMPEGSRAAAIICLGPVKEFYASPMLEEQDWAEAMPLESVLMENHWRSDTGKKT